jgi:ABC-type transport system substrate-binding protein
MIAAAGLPACRQRPQSSATGNGPVTLRFGIAIPPTGTPGSGVGRFINNFVADAIVGIGWDGRTVDRLVAENGWEWGPDELSLKLRLRPSLKFHDGTPVDRSYFRTHLETILKAPQTPGTNVSYQSVTGVELDPDSTDCVIIRLSRPEAFLLTDLANSTLPHPTNPQIGTGPYRVVSLGSSAKLAAFDDYYRGRPKIDFLEIQGFEEQRASWAAMMRGEIDAVHEITPTAIDFVQAEGQTKVHTYPFTRPYYVQLLFNVKHPILKNPAVRQALSYAVDRQAIINQALNRQGTVAEGPIWPFHWAYSTAQKTYTHNTEAATLRLDSAGLRMKKAGAPGQMPSRFRIRCLTLAKDARYERIALILQKQLYEIGVDMEIEVLPGKELIGRLNSGAFDMLLVERTSGRSLAWTYLTFHSSQNPSGYKAADKVLEQLRRTTGDAGVRTAVSDLQQIFHDDPPAIFILWPNVARVVSSKFAVPDEGGRDVMSRFWLWQPAAAGK